MAALAEKALARINRGSRAEMDMINAKYPNFEFRTWSDQEREARAWVADNTVPTPTLTPIAEARGLTMEDLSARVITKADVYRGLVARRVGIRQCLEDTIDAAVAAEDRDTLEAIVWPGLAS